MAKMKQTTVIKGVTKGQMRIAVETAVSLGYSSALCVAEDALLYDPKSRDVYPCKYFGWNIIGSFDAWNALPHGAIEVTFGEFMELLYAHAVMKTPSVTKLGSYDLTYAEDHIMVGCTRVEKTQIEEILKYMNDMK